MQLNAARIAALVLFAIAVPTLGASDVSAGGVVVFASALAEGVIELLIVAHCACCLVASVSASHQSCDFFYRCANISCFFGNILQMCSVKLCDQNGYFWGSYRMYIYFFTPLQIFIPRLEIIFFINKYFSFVYLSTVLVCVNLIDIFVFILC